MRLILQLFVFVSSVILAKAIGEIVNDELLISTELSEMDNTSNGLYKKKYKGSGLSRQVKDLIEIALDSVDDRKGVDKVDVQESDALKGEADSDTHRTKSNETSEVELNTVDNHVQNNDDPTHMNHVVVAGHIEGPAGSEGDVVDSKSSKKDSKENHKHKDSNEAREIYDDISTPIDEVRGVVSKASESHVDMTYIIERVKKTTEISNERRFSSEEKKSIKNTSNDLVVKKDTPTMRHVLKKINGDKKSVKNLSNDLVVKKYIPTKKHVCKKINGNKKSRKNSINVKKDPPTMNQVLKKINGNINNIKRSFNKRSDITLSTESITSETADDLHDNFLHFSNDGSNTKNERSVETIGFSILNNNDYLAVTERDKLTLTKYDVERTTEEYEDYYEANRLFKEEAAKRNANLRNESADSEKNMHNMFTERTIPEMLPSQIPPKVSTVTFHYDITVADNDQRSIKWDFKLKLLNSTEDPKLLLNRTRHLKKQKTQKKKKSKMLSSNEHLTMLSSNLTNSKALNYDFSIADIDQPKTQWIYADEKALEALMNKTKLVKHSRWLYADEKVLPTLVKDPKLASQLKFLSPSYNIPNASLQKPDVAELAKKSKYLSPTYNISVASLQKPDVEVLYTDEKLPAHSSNTKGHGYLWKTTKVTSVSSTENTGKSKRQYNRTFTITKVPLKSTKSSFVKSTPQYTSGGPSSANDETLSSIYRSLKHVSHYGLGTSSSAGTTMPEKFIKKHDLNGTSGQTGRTTTIPRKTPQDIVSKKGSIGPDILASTSSKYHHKNPDYTLSTKTSPTEIPSVTKTMNLDMYDVTRTVTQLDDKSGSKTNATYILSNSSTIQTTSTTKTKTKSYNITKFTVVPLINKPAKLNKTSVEPKYKNQPEHIKKFLNKLSTNKMNSTKNYNPNEIKSLHQTILNTTVEALQKEPWEELAKIANKNAFVDEAIQILFDRTFRHSNSTENHVNNTYDTKVLKKISGNSNGLKLGNTTKERYLELVNKQISNITENPRLSSKARDYISNILNTMITKSYLTEPLVTHTDHSKQSEKTDIDTFLNNSNKSNINDNMTLSKNNYVINDNVTNVAINLNFTKHISTTQRTSYRPVFEVSPLENTGITKGGFLIRSKYKTMHNLYLDYNSENITRGYGDNITDDNTTPSILNGAVPKSSATSTNDPKSPEDKRLLLLSTTVVPVTATSNNIANSTQDKKLSLASAHEIVNMSNKESQKTFVVTTTPKSSTSESSTTDDEDISTTTEIEFLTSNTINNKDVNYNYDMYTTTDKTIRYYERQQTITTNNKDVDYDYDVKTTTDKTIRYFETLQNKEKEYDDVYADVSNVKTVTPEHNNELTVIPHNVTKIPIKTIYPHTSKKTTSYGKNIGTLDILSKDDQGDHKVENSSSGHMTHASVENKITLHNRNNKTDGDYAKDAIDMTSSIPFRTVKEKSDDADIQSSTTGNTAKIAAYMVYTADKENYDNVTTFAVIPYDISQKQMRTSAKQQTAIYSNKPPPKISTYNYVSSAGTQSIDGSTKKDGYYDYKKEEHSNPNALNIVIKNPFHTRLATKYTAKESIKKVGFNFTLPCEKTLKMLKQRPNTTPMMPESILNLENLDKRNISLITMEYHLKPNKTKITTVTRFDKQISEANQDTSIKNNKGQSANALENLPNDTLQVNDKFASNKTFRIFQVLHNVIDLLRSIYEKLPKSDSTKSNITDMVFETHGDMHSKLLNELSSIMNDNNWSKEITDNGTKDSSSDSSLSKEITNNGPNDSSSSVVLDTNIGNLYGQHILEILQNVSSLLDSIHKKILEYNILQSMKKMPIPLLYNDLPLKTMIDVSKILANERRSKALLVDSNNVIEEKKFYENILGKLTTEKKNEMKILKVLHNVSNILVSINDKIPDAYSVTAKESFVFQSKEFIDDGRVTKNNHPEGNFHEEIISTTDTIMLKNKTHKNTTSDNIFDPQSHMILNNTNEENLGIIPDIEKLHTVIISEHIKNKLGEDPNSLPFDKKKHEVHVGISASENVHNETVAQKQNDEVLDDKNFSISISNKTYDNKTDHIVQDTLVDHTLLNPVTPKDTSVTFNSIWMEQRINDSTTNNNLLFDGNETLPKPIENDTETNQDTNNDIDVTAAINISTEKSRNKISSPKLNEYFDSLVRKLVFNKISDVSESQLNSHFDGAWKPEETDRTGSTNKYISVSADTESMPDENEIFTNIILNSKVMNNTLDGVSEAALEKKLSYPEDQKSTTPYLYKDLENGIQKLLRNENFVLPKYNVLKQKELLESITQAAEQPDNALKKGAENQQYSRRMPIKHANLRDFEQIIRNFVQNLTINAQNVSPTDYQPSGPNQYYLSKSTYAPVNLTIKKMLLEKYNNSTHINEQHSEYASASTSPSPANYQDLNRLINLLTLLAKQSENTNGENIPIMSPLYHTLHKLKSFSRLAQKGSKHFHSRPKDVSKQSKAISSWRKLLLCLKKALLKKGKNYINCFFQSQTLNLEDVTPTTFTTSQPASTTKSYEVAIHELKKEIDILKRQTKLLGTENLLKRQYSLPFLREFDNKTKDPYFESNVGVTQSLRKTHRPTSNVLETTSHYQKKNQEIESILEVLNSTRFEKKTTHYKQTEIPIMRRKLPTTPSSVYPFEADTTTEEIETAAFPIDTTTPTLAIMPKNIMKHPLSEKYITAEDYTAHHKVVPLSKTEQTHHHKYNSTTMKDGNRNTHHFLDTIPKVKNSYANAAIHNDKPIRKIASSKPVQLRMFNPVGELEEISSNAAQKAKQIEPKLYVLTTLKPLSFMDSTFMLRTKELHMNLFNTTAPLYPLNPAGKESVESNLESTPTEPAVNLYSLAEQSELSDPTALLLPVQNEANPDLSEEEAIDNVLGNDYNTSKVCGIERSRMKLHTIERYPWHGVLMYPNDKSHTSTSVVLVTREFVIASALDIDRLPKQNFRRLAKVVLGRNCTGLRMGIINYNYHPDFSKGIVNTIALVQIEIKQYIQKLRPICSPPTNVLLGAHFVAVVLSQDCRSSQVTTFDMEHVPLEVCREFYREHDRVSSWPLHFACGRALRGPPCMWQSGTSLVLLQNKRWHLLGFGVAGPGCSAPSRFIDFGAYREWVEHAVLTIGQPAITTIAPNHIILRRAREQLQRHGPCDPEERKQVLFKDITDLKLPDDNNGEYVGKALYNLTIFRDVAYSCIDLTANNVRGEPEPPQMDLQPCYADTPRGSEQSRKMNFCLTILFKTAIKYKIVAYGQPRVTNEKKKFKRTHQTPQFITPSPPKDNFQPDNNIHRYKYSKLKKVQSNSHNTEGRVVRKYEKKVHRSVNKRSKNTAQRMDNYDLLFGNAITSIDYILI